MEITGEYGNIPSWVADWPHDCDFEGDTCDDLRWPGMFLEAKNRRKMAHFIAACGRAFNCLTEMMHRTVGTTVCVQFRAI